MQDTTSKIPDDKLVRAYTRLGEAIAQETALLVDQNVKRTQLDAIENELFARMRDIGDDQLVAVFVYLRDARARANSRANEVDADYKERLEQINAELLRRMSDRKNKGFKTAHGTVYREEDFKPSAADWNTIYRWIAEDEQRIELLEKRLKKDFVKKHMESNKDENDNLGPPPPGVNVLREFVARVRKA
jgi:hypothetical protein